MLVLANLDTNAKDAFTGTTFHCFEKGRMGIWIFVDSMYRGKVPMRLNVV